MKLCESDLIETIFGVFICLIFLLPLFYYNIKKNIQEHKKLMNTKEGRHELLHQRISNSYRCWWLSCPICGDKRTNNQKIIDFINNGEDYL